MPQQEQVQEYVPPLRGPQELPPPLPPRHVDGMWGRAEIAQAAGVTVASVARWRRRFRLEQEGTLPPGSSPLPPARMVVGGVPRWDPWQVVTRLQQEGAVGPDYRATPRGSDAGGGGRPERANTQRRNRRGQFVRS